MSDFSGTPGPWALAPDGLTVWSSDDVRPNRIAQVQAWPLGVGDNNARLISAAPDLLAACQAAGPLLLALGVKTDWPQQVLTTIEMVKAAVIKATAVKESPDE